MITFSTSNPVQLFVINPNENKEIEFPHKMDSCFDSESQEAKSLISSIEYNDLIGSEDVKDYLMNLVKLFNNELSFSFYSNTGYYICKQTSEMDDYSFTYWELFFVNYYINQLEYIFKLLMLELDNIDFYKIYTEYINDNNYSKLIGSSEIDDIKNLSTIFYVNLIKIKDFLENKKHQYEPTGECVWGDNKIALKKLYELTRNKYIEDEGFEYFYSAFLNNHYVGSKRNSFNLLNNHRIVWSYFLNEIQKFFVPYYNINYTEWVTNTVRFKGKSKDKKRVSEILNLYSEEGTNKEKLKKQIKDIEEIIKKVDNYYLNENYPENYNNVHNTSL